jgi:Ca2+-binding RTX toxin-like protein
MGGNDIASGGAGSDVFYHTTQSGTAEITDFDPSVDRIVLLAQYTEFPDIQIVEHKQ